MRKENLRAISGHLLNMARGHLEQTGIVLPVVFSLKANQIPKHRVVKASAEIPGAMKELCADSEALIVVLESRVLDTEGRDVRALTARDDGTIDLSNEPKAEEVLLAVVHTKEGSEMRTIRYAKAEKGYGYFDRGWEKLKELPPDLKNPYLEGGAI